MKATSGFLNLPLRTQEQARAEAQDSPLWKTIEERACIRCHRPKWPSITPHCLHCRRIVGER